MRQDYHQAEKMNTWKLSISTIILSVLCAKASSIRRPVSNCNLRTHSLDIGHGYLHLSSVVPKVRWGAPPVEHSRCLVHETNKCAGFIRRSKFRGVSDVAIMTRRQYVLTFRRLTRSLSHSSISSGQLECALAESLTSEYFLYADSCTYFLS